MASVVLRISLWYMTLALLISLLYANSIASSEVGASDKLRYAMEEQNVCFICCIQNFILIIILNTIQSIKQKFSK